MKRIDSSELHDYHHRMFVCFSKLHLKFAHLIASRAGFSRLCPSPLPREAACLFRVLDVSDCVFQESSFSVFDATTPKSYPSHSGQL
jgi:hypothetical protein